MQYACTRVMQDGLDARQGAASGGETPCAHGGGCGGGAFSGLKRAFASVDNLAALSVGSGAIGTRQAYITAAAGGGGYTHGGAGVMPASSNLPRRTTGELRYPDLAAHLQRQRLSNGAGGLLSSSCAHTPGGAPPFTPRPSAALLMPTTHHPYHHHHINPIPARAMARSSSLMALLQYEAGDSTMCAEDIAVLSSSLPSNFGQPSAATMRRVGSMTSPAMLSRSPSVMPSGEEGEDGLLGSPGRAGSSSSVALPPAPPICLICLEMLTPEVCA
jgi:hypothetical protein